jgi:hypothetical protein
LFSFRISEKFCKISEIDRSSCTRQFLNNFMTAAAFSSSKMCIGEKAIYDCLLKIYPHILKTPSTLTSYVYEIFLYMLQCETFMERFVYWYTSFKSFNKVIIEQYTHLQKFIECLDGLIGCYLVHVRRTRFDNHFLTTYYF